MTYDELPEYYMPYFDNFTGPGWSDGKWQSSTSRAKKKALTKLDTHSKRHDSDYALCDSLSCLDRADEMYSRGTSQLSFVPRFIGKLPKYGNAPLRSVYKALGIEYTGTEVGEKMTTQNSESGNYPKYDPQSPRGAARLRGRARPAQRQVTPATPAPLTPVPGVESIPYSPTPGDKSSENGGFCEAFDILGSPLKGGVQETKFPRMFERDPRAFRKNFGKRRSRPNR